MLLTHTPEFHLFFMPFRQLPYLTLTQEFLNGHSVSSLPSIQLYLVAATSFLTWFRLPLHGTHPKTLLFCHLVLSVWFFCCCWFFFVFFFFGPAYPTLVSLPKMLSLLPILKSQKHIFIPLFVLILTYLHFVPSIKSSTESLLHKTKPSSVDHSGF